MTLVVMTATTTWANGPLGGKYSWDEAYAFAERKVKDLTLDEKRKMMRTYDGFFYYGVPEKGIPFIYCSDATQGVHIRRELGHGLIEHLERSTAFPSPIMLAASFNPGLAEDYGRAVGEECRAGGIEVLFGPGINLTKNPQNGRNYEYQGEDPYLAGLMASSYIKGLQGTGTAACAKHFICNETEFFRRRVNAVVDERALHEVYMQPFQAAVDAGVAFIMTSYNRLNGNWTGQDSYTIDTLIRRDLGFRGAVSTDWMSVNDGRKIVLSGQNVVMPGDGYDGRALDEAFACGQYSEADIDRMIVPLIATNYAMGFYEREKYRPDLLSRFPDHVDVSYRTAAEGIVLLKNDGVLPLAADRKVLVVGRFLDSDPHHDIANLGSSADVEGYDYVSLRQALKDELGDSVTFADKPTAAQIAAADVVLAVIGTIDSEEIERPFALDEPDETLVRMAVDNNAATVVMVVSGGAIDMSGWADRAGAVFYSWYSAQQGMRAVADVLVGKINPSGKLPMTVPRSFRDLPFADYLPEGAQFYHFTNRILNEQITQLWDFVYPESVLVGHRWFDAKGIKPLFAFGHGLSYTTFKMSHPKVTVSDDKIVVRLDVANTGDRAGAEVVQVYVGEENPTVMRPVRELKGISKIFLAPGQSGRVEIPIDTRALSYWCDKTHGWKLNPGRYRVDIGNASDNIIHSATVKL